MTPHRWQRLRSTLDRRQPDLTVLMENVHKPHNFSAVLRTCDAVGVLEAHAWVPAGRLRKHRPTSGGSGKWVRVHSHERLEAAFETLEAGGFQVLAAHLTDDAVDFREADYTRPTALLLGQEKFGVSAEAARLAHGFVSIPMMGLVASLNVSVAAAIILFEAQRQRAAAGLYDRPRLDREAYERTLFEWAYPELALFCRQTGRPYPALDEEGAIVESLPGWSTAGKRLRQEKES